MSDSLTSHRLQHTSPPCPSPSPEVCSNSCPLGQWCHPATSSSVVPFSSCPQSFSASGSFPVSQLFTSDGESTGASASASLLPMNIWGWFTLVSTGLHTQIILNLQRIHKCKILELCLEFFTRSYKHTYVAVSLTKTITGITNWSQHSMDKLDWELIKEKPFAP